MPAGLGSETDASWSLRRRCGVLVGTWNLEPGKLAENPETWQDMAYGCFQWVSLREPRQLRGFGKSKSTKLGFYKGTTLVVTDMHDWQDQLLQVGATHLSTNKQGEAF